MNCSETVNRPTGRSSPFQISQFESESKQSFGFEKCSKRQKSIWSPTPHRQSVGVTKIDIQNSQIPSRLSEKIKTFVTTIDLCEVPGLSPCEMDKDGVTGEHCYFLTRTRLPSERPGRLVSAQRVSPRVASSCWSPPSWPSSVSSGSTSNSRGTWIISGHS